MCALATTVDRCWNENAVFVDTGHNNVKGESINRVIKLAEPAPPADVSTLNHADPTWPRDHLQSASPMATECPW
ncbi:hypothetical protein SCAB_40621 [Streptomyces scabiei 87.22]|uniref:Uncharacterized protein n=1 Tax=Streptomyces scabiei (strain 87.22) TaxID=680198 RepID=C9Z2C4_STRSW|nr:hypothetical protein IQ61_09585 [Streptomyces scabiei]CBG71138.1 hypothetical protein SCAB_40621 [Streptomyces scabiei 87.22]